MMEIIRCNLEDDVVLTAITKKSKAYWGYSEEQMALWSELLTVSKTYIASSAVYKLVVDGVIVGYYSYIYLNENAVKLDNLFVLPAFIGKGFGKQLMRDFLFRVKSSTAKKILLDSEPKAAGFYGSFGFVQIGTLETAIKDRYLPVMELVLH